MEGPHESIVEEFSKWQQIGSSCLLSFKIHVGGEWQNRDFDFTPVSSFSSNVHYLLKTIISTYFISNDLLKFLEYLAEQIIISQLHHVFLSFFPSYAVLVTWTATGPGQDIPRSRRATWARDARIFCQHCQHRNTASVHRFCHVFLCFKSH